MLHGIEEKQAGGWGAQGKGGRGWVGERGGEGEGGGWVGCHARPSCARDRIHVCALPRLPSRTGASCGPAHAGPVVAKPCPGRPAWPGREVPIMSPESGT